MKTFYFSLSLLLISFLVMGQTPEEFNYRVSLSDINLTHYEKDSTANALVLFESGKSYVDNKEYDLNTEVKYKIKIFNKEGFDEANVQVLLYKGDSRHYEKIKDITATTYNLENGKVEKYQLDKNDIFKEEYDEKRTLVKFTLPHIKEGSVITYSYKVISPYFFNYYPWNFQGDIPKLYSEYQASIPANWEYNIKLTGAQKLLINKSDVEKDCLRYISGASAGCFKAFYAMKDIPAFVDEDYMTSESNYRAGISYELKEFKGFDGTVTKYTKSWDAVDNEVKTDQNIGRQLKKSVDAKDLLSSGILSEPDALKRAKAIYKYVQNNYTWDGHTRIFSETDVKDLVKNRSGNIGSINILLHNLLEEADITVKPVLVSTRQNGFPTKLYPVLSDFNYIIIQATINGKNYLLDASDKFNAFGYLPFRCLNQYGRLMDFDHGSQWIDLNPKSTSVMMYQVDVDFDDDLGFVGEVSGKSKGYLAMNLSESYYPNPDQYVEKLQNTSPFIEIYDYEVPDQNESDDTFEESFKVEYNPENTGDLVYINPFIIRWWNENPFKLQERSYPIDFGYKKSFMYIYKLNLGEAYTVESNLKETIVTLPNNAGRLALSSKVLGNTINLTMRVDFKESLYAPEFYPYLKKFLSKIVDIQKNSVLVLKKV
ncbi:DUF3857 domain-containing protein [Gaetbulibacter aestuarii]|uniref:DUF3857 domain-containing protein n=1 Tax=Gaetbulibacter aestuarii TaxID=1502358 RepID=A0ABW7N1T0_9FLAO